MATTDARIVPIKAQAYRLQFALFKNDGTVISAATGLDSEISKDAGAFADCTNEATEIATNSGHYYIDFTTTETNCTSAVYQLKSSSTGAVVYSTEIRFAVDARDVGFVPQVIPEQTITKDSSTEKVLIMVYDLWGRPATGLTFSAAEIQISKQGGVSANSGGVDAEVDATDFPGLYSLVITASESDTEGVVTLNVAKAGYISATQSFVVAPAVTVTSGAYNAHLVSVAAGMSGEFNTVRKNTALAKWPFKMVDATDKYTAETGVTVTCTRSINGGAFAACTNAAVEVSSGWYYVDLAAGDLNGNTIVLRFTGAGCAPYEAVFVTNPT